MRPSQVFTLIAAGLSLTPGVNAALGTSCIGAVNSLNKVPGRFVETCQHYACQAGCEPKEAHWRKYGKKFLSSLVEDGKNFCQIDSPDGEEALLQYLDGVYTEILDQCGPKLNGSHLCRESEESSEFKKCVDSYARKIPSSRLARVLPYTSEERCKKVDEYLNSEQLWEQHFPARVKNYTEHCHQEL